MTIDMKCGIGRACVQRPVSCPAMPPMVLKFTNQTANQVHQGVVIGASWTVVEMPLSRVHCSDPGRIVIRGLDAGRWTLAAIIGHLANRDSTPTLITYHTITFINIKSLFHSIDIIIEKLYAKG
jgi:hypothetical protein